MNAFAKPVSNAAFARFAAVDTCLIASAESTVSTIHPCIAKIYRPSFAASSAGRSNSFPPNWSGKPVFRRWNKIRGIAASAGFGLRYFRR